MENLKKIKEGMQLAILSSCSSIIIIIYKIPADD
jgi:hypothetical protein